MIIKQNQVCHLWEVILGVFCWGTVFPRKHRAKDKVVGPCQSLHKARSFKECILAPERNDDISSNKREWESHCKVLPKGTIGGRRYLAHVHTKNTLVDILIIEKKNKMRRTATKEAGRKTIVK